MTLLNFFNFKKIFKQQIVFFIDIVNMLLLNLDYKKNFFCKCFQYAWRWIKFKSFYLYLESTFFYSFSFILGRN